MSLQQQLDRLLKGYHHENGMNDETESSERTRKRPEYLDFGDQSGVPKPPPPPPSDRPHTPPPQEYTEDSGGQRRSSVEQVSSQTAPQSFAEKLKKKLEQGQRLNPREKRMMTQLRQQLAERRKVLQEQLDSVSRLRTEKEHDFLRYQALDKSRASELQYNSLADRQALEAEVAPLTLPSGAEFQKSLESLEKLGNDAGTPSRNRSTTHAVSPERKEMDPLAHSHWVLHQASREVQQRKQTQITSKQMSEHLDRVLQQKRELIQSKRDELHNLYNRILELSHNLNVANERVTQRDIELLEARQKLAKLVKATQELVQLSREYEIAGGTVQFSSTHALEDLATTLSSVTNIGAHKNSILFAASHDASAGSNSVAPPRNATSNAEPVPARPEFWSNDTTRQRNISSTSYPFRRSQMSHSEEEKAASEREEHRTPSTPVPSSYSAPQSSSKRSTVNSETQNTANGDYWTPYSSIPSSYSFHQGPTPSASKPSKETSEAQSSANGEHKKSNNRLDFNFEYAPSSHTLMASSRPPNDEVATTDRQLASAPYHYSHDPERMQSIVAASEQVLSEARKFSPRFKEPNKSVQ